MTQQRRRPGEQQLRAWEAFLRSHRRAIEALDRELRESHRLPLEQYDVLWQLSQAGGRLAMTALARAVLVSPPTCTRLVDRMAVLGLVAREVDTADARVKYAVLTAEGRSVQRRAAVTHLSGIERHFGRFVDDDLAGRMAVALDDVAERGAGS